MGRIDIRQIEQYDDEPVRFQKIKKKKPTDQIDDQITDRKPSKLKK